MRNFSFRGSLLYLYVQRRYRLNKKAEPDKTALKGRWDVLANSIANIVHENVDIFFITLLCRASEVSVYTVYALVSQGLIRLMQVFTNGMEAAFGDMWAKKEMAVLKKNFEKYEYLMFSVAQMFSGCMLVLILPFVKVYTKNVTDVEYIRPLFALLLTLAVGTMCIRMPYVTLVQAAGHYKQTKVGSFVEAAINIVLTVTLIPFLGIVGAVIGTVAANTFRSFQYGHYVSKHLLSRPFTIMIKRVLWLIGTTALSVLASNLILQFIVVSNWLSWVYCVLISLTVHFLILIVSSWLFYRDNLSALGESVHRIIKRKG